MIQGWSTAAPTANGYFWENIHSQSSTQHFNIVDPVIDDLADQQFGESDPEARRELFLRIMEQMNEEAYWMDKLPASGGHLHPAAGGALCALPRAVHRHPPASGTGATPCTRCGSTRTRRSRRSRSTSAASSPASRTHREPAFGPAPLRCAPKNARLRNVSRTPGGASRSPRPPATWCRDPWRPRALLPGPEGAPRMPSRAASAPRRTGWAHQAAPRGAAAPLS